MSESGPTGIKKTPETCYASGESGHLTIEHVEKVGDDQNDAGPEKFAVTEKKAGADVDGDADDSKDVGVDVTVGKPTHHRVNNSLRPTANATHKHFALDSPHGIMPKSVVS